LVARVRLGDEGAFQSLFEAYYATLCDFAQSYLHSPELAEELVQTVFLRIWEHRVRWEPTTGVRAYLFAACHNQALGVLKHERIVLRAAQRARSEEVVTPDALAGSSVNGPGGSAVTSGRSDSHFCACYARCLGREERRDPAPPQGGRRDPQRGARELYDL